MIVGKYVNSFPFNFVAPVDDVSAHNCDFAHHSVPGIAILGLVFSYNYI